MRRIHDLAVRALPIAVLAVPDLGQSADYRWEVGGSFSRVSIDRFDEFDIDNWGLYGTFFFEDVRTDLLPLQEAAFLGRSSFLSLEPSRVDAGFIGNTDTWRIRSDYYVPNTWLYLGAGVSHTDPPDIHSGGNVAVATLGSDTAWEAAIGITPLAGLRLSSSFYQHVDYQPNLDVKYVGKFGDDHFYGLGLSLVDPDYGDVYYNVTADYFFDRTLRLGAELGKDLDYWGLSADKFFTEKASAGLSYTDFEGAHSLGARVAWRF
jgi:hypothetical protein